jgi:PKD repeat protein
MPAPASWPGRLVPGLTALLLTGAAAYGATFYTSPTGAGADCTQVTPCSLSTALGKAESNGEDDVVRLAAGTYTSGTGFYFSAPASENHGLTVEAGPGVRLGDVILDGQGVRQVLDARCLYDASHTNCAFTLRGLTFVNGKFTSYGGAVHLINWSGGILVEDCTFRESTTTSRGGGLHVESVLGDISIRRSSLVSNDASEGGGFFASTQGTFRLSDSVVRDNSSSHPGGGFQAQIGAAVVERSVITGNRVTLERSGGGIEFYGIQDGGSIVLRDNVIANNTANTAGGVIVFPDRDGGSCVLVNNTVVGNQAVTVGGVFVAADGANQVQLLNNLLWGNGPAGVADLFVRLGSGATASGYHNDVGSMAGSWTSSGDNLSIEPQLVNLSGGDYHLRTTSPLVDAGTAAVPDPPGLSVTDFEGGPRMVGPAPDIGADEVFVAGTLAAAAVADPASGAAPLSTQLIGQVTGGTPPYSFDWDFGDGSAHSTKQAPTHVYGSGGTYRPVFTVRDSAAAVATDGRIVLSVGGSCTLTCNAPVPLTANTGIPVGFAASGSGCPGPITYDWDFGDGSAHSSLQYTSHVYAFAGSYGWKVNVKAGSQTCTRAGTITVAGLPPASGLLVPAIAHVSGYGGTPWRSDLAIVNPGLAAATATLTYVSDSVYAITILDLPAGATREWRNILETLYALPASINTSGTMYITSNTPLLITSRNYADMPSGTYGQYFPALIAAHGVGPGEIGILPQLKSNALFYSNVGVVNLGAAPCTVRIRLFDLNGAGIGSATDITLEPRQWKQANKIFDTSGAGTRDVAYGTVEVLTSGGLAWAYGAIIDQRSKDPTTIPMLVP